MLASASASRRALLSAARVDFTIQPADLDEPSIMAAMAGATPQGVAARLAREKACAVSRTNPGKTVLGADSVLALGPRLISKSPDLGAARALLQDLRGREHLLVSAASLARDGVEIWSHAATVRLTMRDVSDAFLDGYLAAEGDAILGSVGCYHFEGRGAQLFDKVDGDYFAVLGLPLLDVLAALRKEGLLAS